MRPERGGGRGDVDDGAEAPGGIGRLAGGVTGDDADDRFAIAFERDERPEERHPVDERFSAVDGVENPAVVAVAGSLSELLAEDAVTGALSFEEGADRLLGVTVGDGHWGA